MSVADIAGLIAAIAFVLLVGVMAVPLVKLGRVLDEARVSVRQVTDHAVPVLDETAATIASTNAQLGKVDSITTSAAQVGENVSALTSLVVATVGEPLLKLAALSYGVRRAVGAVLPSRASR